MFLIAAAKCDDDLEVKNMDTKQSNKRNNQNSKSKTQDYKAI